MFFKTPARSVPAYTIFCLAARYDNRDAIVGTTARPVRYCETAAFAAKVAALYSQRADEEGSGDCTYVARPLGVSPFTSWTGQLAPVWDLETAELPF